MSRLSFADELIKFQDGVFGKECERHIETVRNFMLNYETSGRMITKEEYNYESTKKEGFIKKEMDKLSDLIFKKKGIKNEIINDEDTFGYCMIISLAPKHVLLNDTVNEMVFESKDYERLMENFSALTQEKVSFLEKRKERHWRTIKTIEQLLEEVK